MQASTDVEAVLLDRRTTLQLGLALGEQVDDLLSRIESCKSMECTSMGLVCDSKPGAVE